MSACRRRSALPLPSVCVAASDAAVNDDEPLELRAHM